MSLNSYLADNYGQPAKKKHKKKTSNKSSEDQNAVTISETTQTVHLSPVDVSSDTIKNSNNPKVLWKNLDTNEVSFNRQAEQPGDIKEDNIEDLNVVKLSSGAHAGLQSTAQVEAQMIQEELNMKKQIVKTQKNQEVVYRDETGRRIDNSSLHEDLLQDKEDRREVIRRKKIADLNVGEVQKYLKEHNLKELPEKSAQESFIDEEDPLAKMEIAEGKNSKPEPRTFLGRKLYHNIFPENRFGIIPGYRWDGVDRSNGFEKKWFDKKNSLETKKVESYTNQEEF